MTNSADYYAVGVDLLLEHRNEEISRRDVAKYLGQPFDSKDAIETIRAIQRMAENIVSDYQGRAYKKTGLPLHLQSQRLIEAGGVLYHCGWATYVFDMDARLGKRRINHNRWPVLGKGSRVIFPVHGDPAAEPEVPAEVEEAMAEANAVTEAAPEPPWTETVTLIHEDGDTLVLKYKGEVLVTKVVSRT